MIGQLTDPNLETELCRDVFCCVRMANSTVGNSKAMKEEDCLGCRLVSGFGLFFIGAYLYRQSQRQSGTFSKITVVSLSAGT